MKGGRRVGVEGDEGSSAGTGDTSKAGGPPLGGSVGCTSGLGLRSPAVGGAASVGDAKAWKCPSSTELVLWRLSSGCR